MIEGEIYFGKNNRKGRHPMVFLSEIDEYSFEGLMLTHAPIRDNMLLRTEHFEWVDKKFDTTNTHFVRRKLIKKTEWKPFTLVGKLSPAGIETVRQAISGTELSYFD